jgi:hypothetical protein
MILIVFLAAITAIAIGCTSSGSTTAEAPPETPEQPPGSHAGTSPPSSISQGSGAGSGSGTAGDAGDRDEGSAGGAGAGDTTGEAGGSSSADDGGESGVEPSTPGGSPPAGSAPTADESTAALEAELAATAGAFDARMLEELRRLAAESAERSGGSSLPPDSSASRGSATADSNTDGADGGDNSGEVGGASSEAAGARDIPPDVGDGSDDDIVARQLREAAIEETDPELREKLWDEYRRYKASVGGSSKDDS